MPEAQSNVELDGPRFLPASGARSEQLVILLHGVGADGNDLIGLAPQLGQVLPAAAFVSPHAPFPFDMAPTGRQWFSLQDLDPHIMAGHIAATGPILDRYIDDLVAELGLADDKLALFGFSQGCMMALYVALRRAAPCAAVLGYSGMLVVGPGFEAEIKSRPPVLLVHGTADPVVPAASLGHTEAALEAAGLEVEAYMRPGLAHGIDPEGLRLGADFLRRKLGSG